MALTDKLTNIANAIRSKSGSTGSLTLDQMPMAIQNIPSGGLPEGFEMGEFTPTEDITGSPSYKIYHSLERVPNIVAIYADTADLIPVGIDDMTPWMFLGMYTLGQEYKEDLDLYGSVTDFIRGAYSTGRQLKNANSVSVPTGALTNTFFEIPFSRDIVYKANQKYKWLAMTYNDPIT